MSRFFELAVVAVPAMLALAGCDDPAKDAPKATVAPASTTTAAAHATTAPTMAKPAAMGDALTVDPTSSVGFVGSKVTGKHEGKFEKVSGTVNLAGGKIEGGKIHLKVEIASLKSDQEKLDGHLKSKDFFDAEKFPEATFTSTEIKAGGDKGASDTVTGDLELHGVKKSITFPATITVSGDSVSGTAEFSINRKDFGIVYPGKPDDLIRDDVVLKLSLKAKK